MCFCLYTLSPPARREGQVLTALFLVYTDHPGRNNLLQNCPSYITWAVLSFWKVPSYQVWQSGSHHLSNLRTPLCSTSTKISDNHSPSFLEGLSVSLECNIIWAQGLQNTEMQPHIMALTFSYHLLTISCFFKSTLGFLTDITNITRVSPKIKTQKGRSQLEFSAVLSSWRTVGNSWLDSSAGKLPGLECGRPCQERIQLWVSLFTPTQTALLCICLWQQAFPEHLNVSGRVSWPHELVLCGLGLHGGHWITFLSPSSMSPWLGLIHSSIHSTINYQASGCRALH